MLIYRIDRIKYSESLLSGQGAMLHGGRWNHKNTPAVYASATRSLALLEILVHIRKIGLMPRDRIMVTIEIPDNGIIAVHQDQLSKYWNDKPNGHPSNMDLFEKGVIQTGRLGMAVPSVILPQEANYVLYPNASTFSQVKVIDVQPLDWDYRL